MTEEVAIQKVYCQNPGCGKDITERGGKVSGSGRIYCHGYSDGPMCIDHEMIAMQRGDIPGDVVIFNYRGPEEIQKLIKNGTLTHFDPLE